MFILVKSEHGYESTSQKISVNGVVEEILHAKNTCTTIILMSYDILKFGDIFFDFFSWEISTWNLKLKKLSIR